MILQPESNPLSVKSSDDRKAATISFASDSLIKIAYFSLLSPTFAFRSKVKEILVIISFVCHLGVVGVSRLTLRCHFLLKNGHRRN